MDGINTNLDLQKLAKEFILKDYDLDISKQIPKAELLTLWEQLDSHFQGLETDGELLLPNLSAFKNETVAVFSDYSGDHGGDYLTYSFLICSWNNLELFNTEVKKIRKKYNLGNRELNYKNLERGKQRLALPEFLKAASGLINGYLFNIAVSKDIPSLFDTWNGNPKERLSSLLKTELNINLKKKGVEKFLRINHIIAYLLKLLLREPQKVIWITDNDDICSNDTLADATMNFQNKLIGMWQAKVEQLLFSTQSNMSTQTVNDLLAIPDIAAGGFREALQIPPNSSHSAAPWKDGSGWVCDWMNFQGLALKQSNMLIYRSAHNRINSRRHFFNVTPRPKWANDKFAIQVVRGS